MLRWNSRPTLLQHAEHLIDDPLNRLTTADHDWQQPANCCRSPRAASGFGTGDETWFKAALKAAFVISGSTILERPQPADTWQASAQRCRGAMTVSHSSSAAPSWDSF